MTPEQEIRRRIRDSGAVTFAEFMEVALYWPDGGYYSYQPGAAEPFGAAGDYFTSPLAHPTFGALLAAQLYQFWQLMDAPNPFTVVEQGAGNGLLCHDIVTAAAGLPDGFGRCLRYLCVDRRSVPGSGYGYEVGQPGVNRMASLGLALRGVRGCILSNELLDAFPVHLVRKERGRLLEVYLTLDLGTGDRVSADDAQLVETLAEPSNPGLAARLAEAGIELAEGQTAEINLGLEAWAEGVSASLDAGYVLTIDYGRMAEELYSARLRPRGTLTTFYRHVQTDAPLRDIGRQDMTAYVDFTAVVNAGRRVGLTPLGFTTQGRFLRNLGLDRYRRRLAAVPFSRGLAEANRAGLAALARSGGLGDFRALVQGKNVGNGNVGNGNVGNSVEINSGIGPGRPTLWGFGQAPAAQALELAETLPVPLLTDRHIALPDAWPRAAEQEFEFDPERLWPGQGG